MESSNDHVEIIREAFRYTQAFRNKTFVFQLDDAVVTDPVISALVRDLVLLQSEFQAVLTDSASRVKVVDLPESPSVRVESDEQGWLDFQLGYSVEDHDIPFDKIWDSRGGTIRPDDHTFVRVPEDEPSPWIAGARLSAARVMKMEMTPE